MDIELRDAIIQVIAIIPSKYVNIIPNPILQDICSRLVRLGDAIRDEQFLTRLVISNMKYKSELTTAFYEIAEFWKIALSMKEAEQIVITSRSIKTLQTFLDRSERTSWCNVV